MNKIKRALKKPSFWISLFIFLIILVFLASWMRRSNTRNFTTEEWHRVVLSSYEVEDIAKFPDYSESRLDTLRKSLTEMQREAIDVEFSAHTQSGITHSRSASDELAEICKQVANYSASSAETLALIRSGSGQVSEDTFSGLSSQELQIDESYHDFNDNLKSTDEIPTEALSMSSYLKDLENYYLAEVQKTEKQKELDAKKTIEQQEQEEREIDAVRAATETFINAQIDGDVDKVDNSITTGYSREFDFDALEPDSMARSRIVYYRITEISKISDNVYSVGANLTNSYSYETKPGEQDTSESTYQKSYEVILQTGGESWLVNREIRDY